MYWSCCYKPVISTFVLLAALTADATGFAQNSRPALLKPPMTGTAVPEYAPLDRAVLDFGYLIKCTAATVAVSKDGELLYSRGYGWRDARKKQPTPPNTIMRIAYASRSITSAAIYALIHDEKITLDTKVFEYLKFTPPPGVKQDPRLATVTVGQLLKDQGGWDKKETFDPMFATQKVEEYFKLPRPAQQADIIRFMLGQPLQFDPGERVAMSNFGYCLLGRVIEKASGQPYGTYIQDEICKPNEIADIKLGRTQAKDRDPREVWYPGLDVSIELLDSCAGLIASAPDLCTFMDHYWLDGRPRYAGQTGESRTWGLFSCTTALLRERRDGYNVAVLFNSMKLESYQSHNEELWKNDMKVLDKMIDDAMDEVAKAGTK